jgi:alpha-L-fucosidase
MRVNGEAIHGTTASPFDALPWGRCTVRAAVGSDRSTPAAAAAEVPAPNGIEFSTLYFHVFDWPADRTLALPGLANEVGRAWLLARPDETLAVMKEDGLVRIALPAEAPDPAASVVALEVQGRPLVHRMPRIEADSDVFVRPLAVRIGIEPATANAAKTAAAAAATGPSGGPATGSAPVEVRVTTDGSEPTVDSPHADGGLTLDDTATVKARAFVGGRAASGIAEATFTRVVPRAPVAPAPAAFVPGLRVERFLGEWDALPDFDSLEPASTSGSAIVALPSGLREERVGLRFTGYLEVPRDDVYAFVLSSDDGSRLDVSGETVVDNDGLHATVSKWGRVALAAGLHPIRVEWFNKTGGAELALYWGTPGDTLVTVPPNSFRRAVSR